MKAERQLDSDRLACRCLPGGRHRQHTLRPCFTHTQPCLESLLSCHASDITMSRTACTHHVTDSTHARCHRQHTLTHHRQHALTMSQTSTSKTFLPANRANPDSTVEPDTVPLPWCHSALDRLWWRARAPPLPFEMWLLLSLPLSVPLLLPLEVETLRPTLPACT